MSGSSHAPPPPPTGLPVSPLADNSNDYVFDLSQLKPPPSFTQKLWYKTKQDPLVPIGFIATCAALTGGVIAMARDQSHASQKFMRLRVGAQAFTLVAVVYALSSKVDTGSTAAAQQSTGAAAASGGLSPAAASLPASSSPSPSVAVPAPSASSAAV